MTFAWPTLISVTRRLVSSSLLSRSLRIASSSSRATESEEEPGGGAARPQKGAGEIVYRDESERGGAVVEEVVGEASVNEGVGAELDGAASINEGAAEELGGVADANEGEADIAVGG